MKLINEFKAQLATLGEIKRVWLTSFNINIGFIETYLLPAVLGMDEPPKNRREFERLQFELTRQGIDFRVYCDQRLITQEQHKRTPMTILPVSVRQIAPHLDAKNSLFHPKVIYLEDVHGNMILGAGSANLTLSGWGRNQEAMDFRCVSNDKQYQQIKSFFTAVDPLTEPCFRVRRKFSHADPYWDFIHSFSKKTLLKALAEGESIKMISVWSPYLPADLAGFIDTVSHSLGNPMLKITLVPDLAQGYFLRTSDSEGVAALRESGRLCFCHNPIERDERSALTHAKVWLATGETSARLAIGSWNFTHPGCGSVKVDSKEETHWNRTLLLSATPNHSSSRNVADIFSYFTHPESVSPDGDAKTLLKTFAIRRLRKMQGQGITNNKYNYRNERVTAASFANNPDAELFFALYQKELVKTLGAKGENRQFQYGYLEGFESTGIVAREDHDTETENADEVAKDAFHQAPDSDLLAQLTKEFQDIYTRFPDHPKYGTLVKECVPEALFNTTTPLYTDKHLIFVRRIPSVREITQRINAEYDELMAKEIIAAWDVQSPDKTLEEWRRDRWSRRYFNRFTQTLAEKITPTDLFGAHDAQENQENDEQQLNELKLSSKIADLFVAKTSGIKRTDCTNVSLRFRRPENLFSLFLEPAADYLTAEYHTYYRMVEQQRDSFSDAARDYRRSQWGERQTLLNSANTKERQYSQPLKTAWGMMFPLLPAHCQQQILKWNTTNPAIVENLGNYLKAGYMFASPVMIELYCWYTHFSRNNTLQEVQERYRHFTDSIADKLPGSLLLRYFINGIDTFEAMCEKITDHALTGWEIPWRELTSLSSPAWYASGETDNRQRLILGFNSPFYPNVLVATSVFQQGVNLHLQCNQVHHYGIAWTPGDNEQRVGRIDRLLGRVNHLLKEHGSTELRIHYPYLAQSLDQDQLAAFILHKRNFEAKLDACDFGQFSRDINLKDDVGCWEDALRKPQVDLKPADPYPVSLGRKQASSKGS